MLNRLSINRAASMAKNILAAGKQRDLLTDRLLATKYNNKEQGA